MKGWLVVFSLGRRFDFAADWMVVYASTERGARRLCRVRVRGAGRVLLAIPLDELPR